jgi:ribosome modulation factor
MALVLQTGRALLRAYDRGYEAAMQSRSRVFMRDVTPRPAEARSPYSDPAMPHVDFGP